MTEHIGCERHAVEGRGRGNSRNGTHPKTVTTEIGDVELAVLLTATLDEHDGDEAREDECVVVVS